MIVEFNDENIKNDYKAILKKHHAIDNILCTYFNSDNVLKIMDVINDEYNTQIIISSNNSLINLYVDILDKKIKIYDDTKQYITIYDDIPKMTVYPNGYLYQNENISIYKRPIVNLTNENKLFYEVNDTSNTYTIIIDCKNIQYNENDLINRLLNNKKTSIKDLFLDITKYLNINLFDIKIADSKGSIIVVQNGELIKYIEYIENKDNYSKVYLENNDFYMERMVKENYNDESLHLLKNRRK